MARIAVDAMQLYLLFIFGSFFNFCNSDCTRSKQMVQNELFSNKIITKDSLWNKTGVSSRAECASACYREERCVSIFYNSITRVCTAHAVQFYSTEPSQEEDGSLYHTMEIDKQDCAGILNNDPSSKDGVYVINPIDGKGHFKVYCDMTTDDGGWTIFQRKSAYTLTTFNHNWKTYKRGFGTPSLDFWLGLEKIHRLTTGRPTQLRVEVKKGDNAGFAAYSHFSVGSENTNYSLSVSGFQGQSHIGDSLASHNGIEFSTKNQDNRMKCADSFQSGWWFKDANDCGVSNLNGEFTIRWNSWEGMHIDWTEMKLKHT